ncbi:PfaD family polyunsaturated fatty acid/polyketide biosynthesis protein [soil metagenome]
MIESNSLSQTRFSLGWWRPEGTAPTTDAVAIRSLMGHLQSSIAVVETPTGIAVAPGGSARFGGSSPSPNHLPLLAHLPPLTPDLLGDPAFLNTHGIYFPYMTGAMANGIGSCEIVEAMAHAGMLGSFGAAGLSIDRVTNAIDRLSITLRDKPWCINFIHSPNEPTHEATMAELLLARNVKLVEASAYLDLTPPIVHYRVAGFQRDSDGKLFATNRVIAKVSRVEVATKFLSPPPAKMVQDLVAAGKLTAAQAEIAAKLPMCDDLIAEADSGGHTDNRPAITLLPTIIALRDRLQNQFQFANPVRVGLAGGIATPASAAAAFSMGAAFVVTGSVNQACVESGSSDAVRKMLAEAGQADVIMAPAADMFEMGVKVQVLKRGTMFAMRAQKLFDLYRMYPDWESVPAADRSQIEKSYFKASFNDIWAETQSFFSRRDPTQLAKAEQDPRHRMALVFRWYLGLSSRWANSGDAARQMDYQVWCGPAMGAFNEWVKGSPLELPANRTVVSVARNLLYGACVSLRRQSLRQSGVHLPENCFPSGPLTTDELERRI